MSHGLALACILRPSRLDRRGSAGRRIEQQRLRRSTVLVSGGGGVGTAVTSALASSGVGTIVVVDPQNLDIADFNRNLYARVSDLGRAKAVVLARAFVGRPHVTVVPIIAKAERRTWRAYVGRIDAVVSASNTMISRLAMARFALRRRVPLVAAAVDDGRTRLGGLVVMWHPAAHRLACPACLLTPRSRVPRGEALLPTVVTTVGTVAAHQVLRLVVGRGSKDSPNVVEIDLTAGIMESLTLLRRPGCRVCARHVARDEARRS